MSAASAGVAALPHLMIDELRLWPDGTARLVGTFSHVRGVRNDGGCLLLPDGRFLHAQLDAVPAAAGERVRIVTSDVELVPELARGTAYAWLDIYWQPYHVAMILAGRWEPRIFAAAPAHYFRLGGVRGWQPAGEPLPDGAEDLGLRDGGWDHEHCELCNAQIGGSGDPRGFVAPDDRWLCAACHARYAVPRDLSFVTAD